MKMFDECGVRRAQVTKDWVTIVALLVGGIWALAILKDPIKRHHELELLRSQVERSPSVEIEMDAKHIGEIAKESAHIVVHVRVRNEGLEHLEIDTKNATLFIRHMEYDEKVEELHIQEYGRELVLVESLGFAPGGERRLSYIFPVERSGIYRVVFEIPVSTATWDTVQYSATNESWTAQEFVSVE